MIITTITPTRNDRQSFIAQCRTILNKQTLQPTHTLFVDYEPESSEPDLHKRVTQGIRHAERLNSDLIFIIEDDDYYPPNYLADMVQLWKQNGHPELFGVASSLYYHIGINKFKMMYHSGRASLYQTMISKLFKFDLESLKAKNFDVNLWQKYTGTKKAILIDDILSVGIKHGIGLCGGIGHRAEFFDNGETDYNKEFLKSITNGESFYLHPVEG